MGTLVKSFQFFSPVVLCRKARAAPLPRLMTI